MAEAFLWLCPVFQNFWRYVLRHRPLAGPELLGRHAQPVGKGAAKAFFAGKAAGLGNALERHVGAQQQGAGILPAHLVLQLL